MKDDQAAAPPVGLVVATTWLLPSTATQSATLVQLTPDRELVPSTPAAVHDAEHPVGFVEVTTSPLHSATATQNPALGHDTPSKPFNGRGVTALVPEPPMGLLEETASPL